MAKATIEMEVRVTWVRYAIGFICKFIRSKWLINKMSGLTIARLYTNGVLAKTYKLSDIINVPNIK